MSKQSSTDKKTLYQTVLYTQHGDYDRPKLNPVQFGQHRGKRERSSSQASEKGYAAERPRYSTDMLSGSLSVEQRSALERVFAHYSGYDQSKGVSYLRFNKYRKMIHEGKLPIDKTAAELIFYGENKHRYVYV